MFADKLIDPTTGLLAFDTFNTDGLLGNVFLVNGKVQPFFEVSRSAATASACSTRARRASTSSS